MFGRKSQKDVEEIVAGYRNEIKRQDNLLKGLTADLSVERRVSEGLEQELIHERKRGPAVDVGSVAFKTGSLLSGSDILVGSDGVTFWEIGPITATNAEWTYLVKR